jgi:hypothetical protein
MAEMQQMLARRAQIAEEMSQAAGRMDVLVREEQELAAQIRRELSRAGIVAWRCAAPWGPRLTELVDGQQRNVRALLATKAA